MDAKTDFESIFSRGVEWIRRETSLRDADLASDDAPLPAPHGISSAVSFRRRLTRVLATDLDAFVSAQQANIASLSKDRALDAVSAAWAILAPALSVRAAMPPGRERLVLAPTLRAVERVGVWLLGHLSRRVRDHALRLLHSIYDGVNWHSGKTPLPCTFACAGDTVSLRATFDAPLPPDAALFIQLIAPAFERSEALARDVAAAVTATAADTSGALHSAALLDGVLTLHRPHAVTAHPIGEPGDGSGGEGGGMCRFTVQLRLRPLPRPGFYDWRVVVAGAPGAAGGATPPTPATPLPSDTTAAATTHAGPRPPVLRPVLRGGGAAQSGAAEAVPAAEAVGGRVLALPRGARAERLHECVVDLVGAQVDAGASRLARRGRLLDVAGRVPELAERGVSTLLLVGAVERDNGPMAAARTIEAAERAADGTSASPAETPTAADATATEKRWAVATAAPDTGALAERTFLRPDASPMAPVCRRTPPAMLGGRREWGRLVSAARTHGVRLMTQLDPGVSAARPHRRYTPLRVGVLDHSGQCVPHRGTDGRENQWEDQTLLNYRLLETWDTAVADAVAGAAELGVRGSYVTDAQSWPVVLAPDTQELWRADVDDEDHYSTAERVDGRVVRPNEEMGFWATAGAAAGFPSPILAKLSRELWTAFPDYLLAGDAAWGREASVAAAGVLPRSLAAPQAVALSAGHRLLKSGAVQPAEAAADGTAGDAVRAWLRREAEALPPSAREFAIRSTCSHATPYPALLFGRATWPAVDLLALLPGVPLCFQDEEQGASYRVDVTSAYLDNKAWMVGERRRLRAEARAAAHTAEIASRRAQRRRDRAAERSAAAAADAGAAVVPGPSAEAEAGSEAGSEAGAASERRRGVPARPRVEATVPGGRTGRMGRAVAVGDDFWTAIDGGDNSGEEGGAATPEDDTDLLWQPRLAPRQASFSAPEGETSGAGQRGGAGGKDGGGGGGGGRLEALVEAALAADEDEDEDEEDDEAAAAAAAAAATDIAESVASASSRRQGLGEEPKREAAGGEVWVSRPPLQDAPSRVHHLPGDHDAAKRRRRSQRRGQRVGARQVQQQHGGMRTVQSWSSMHSLAGAATSGDEAVDEPLLGAGGSAGALPELGGAPAAAGHRLRALSPNTSSADLGTLERRHRAALGPDYGFDLSLIGAHYAHRTALRERFRVLRAGATLPASAAHADGAHRDVVAVCRLLVAGAAPATAADALLRRADDPPACVDRAAGAWADDAATADFVVGASLDSPSRSTSSNASSAGGDNTAPVSPSAAAAGDKALLVPIRDTAGTAPAISEADVVVALAAVSLQAHAAEVSVSCPALAETLGATYALPAAAARHAAATSADDDGADRPRASQLWPAVAAAGPRRAALDAVAALCALADPDRVLAGFEVLHGTDARGSLAAALPPAVLHELGSGVAEAWPEGVSRAVARGAALAGAYTTAVYPGEAAHAGPHATLRPFSSACFVLHAVPVPAAPRPPPPPAAAPAFVAVERAVAYLVEAADRQPDPLSHRAFADAWRRLCATLAQASVGAPRRTLARIAGMGAAEAEEGAVTDAQARRILRHTHVFALLRIGLLAAAAAAAAATEDAAEGGASAAGRKTGAAAGAASTSALLAVAPAAYPLYDADTHAAAGASPPARAAALVAEGAAAGGRVLRALFALLSRRLLAWRCATRGSPTDPSAPASAAASATSPEDDVATVLRAALPLASADAGVPEGRALTWLAAAAGAVGAGGGAEEEAAVEAEAEDAGRRLAAAVLAGNSLGEVVFVTPELGKWSTVGGLGVMVDELTLGLAALGVRVTCISPYYDKDRKGRSGYLAADGIEWKQNISTVVGGAAVDLGVHEGKVGGVRVLFLHNAAFFPRPYPDGDAEATVRSLAVFAKGALETLCQLRLIPSVVVTNDWFTGLVPAYGKAHEHFGEVFRDTTFMHVAHNLDPTYEGRVYPLPWQGALESVHGLSGELFCDPFWGGQPVVNPSRCAMLRVDTWATVSSSYKEDLLRSSPLSPLLRTAAAPFGHPNGIPVASRRARLAALDCNTHAAAKAALQRKYFGITPDPTVPLFAFVGRITEQKGVHLIVDTADHIIRRHRGRVQFIIGGMASASDKYGLHCATKMRSLTRDFPRSFWADPEAFFTDGPLVNLGADFGLMPSLFEPGGIVQQEFHVAGTPVVAFRTGGLKDTVIEFDPETGTGNGLNFLVHRHDDFVKAVDRAIGIFRAEASYALLRANAEASVVDLTQVSWAWYSEFARVRRTIRGDVVQVFRYRHAGPGPQPAEVLLFGSFNGWAQGLPMAHHADVGEWVVPLRLEPGFYHYKFKVDGQWVLADDLPAMRDGATKNHCLAVGDDSVHHTAQPED